MRSQVETSVDRKALMPLLRSILRELLERRWRVIVLEERLDAFASTRRIHSTEVSRLEAELSTHRRELRHVGEELERLGVDCDMEHPEQIVSEGRMELALEPRLEASGFFWQAAFES